MPYKDDNLEELFKRAANDYPLKTDNGDWDKVAKGLHDSSVNFPAGKKSNACKFAAAVILLAGVFTIYFADRQQNQQSSKTNGLSLMQPKTVEPAGTIKTKDNSQSLSSLKNNIALQQENALPVKHQYVNQNNLIIYNHSFTGKNITSISSKTNDVAVDQSGKINPEKSITVSNKPATGFAIQPLPTSETKQTFFSQKSIIEKNLQELPADNLIQVHQKESAKAIHFKPQPSKFYGTFYGGMQFSSIKSQKIEHTGYTVGIGLAYRMNNRFDVEIGLQREQINYYTNGKYFDKSGLKVKDGVPLENVTAKSSLTSVPVTLRYNFNANGKGSFYAGVGTNVLTLTHTEKYDYTTSRNGDLNNRSRNFKSVTAPKYFTSINASAGYKNKLCNWCNYKVEPYYQLPVTKLGVGKLPVTNFGINIGIVKDLR